MMSKRIFFWAVLLLLIFSIVELGIRFSLAALIGRSVLWYGTSIEREAVQDVERSALLREIRNRRLRGAGDAAHTARHADDVRGAYFKYRPHQERVTYDADTGEVYPVTINGQGFRGSDFPPDKKPGVVRVLTLGSSSTFGYHNRDDQTYPVQLERKLNQGCAEHDYEVLNLGVPHLTSAQILALFLAEGVPLAPDVVTFHEGYNDAHEIAGRHSSPDQTLSLRKRFSRWARDHLLTVEFVNEVVGQWTKRYRLERLGPPLERKKREFLANLDELRHACEQNGALFIVASQQARSLTVPREDLRGVTYAEEVATVRERLARSGTLSAKEVAFLGHEALMRAEEEWARENGVPFVDVKSALDRHRDQVVSWVHLSHAANRMIAEELAREILERTCVSAPSRPRAARTTPAHPAASRVTGIPFRTALPDGGSRASSSASRLLFTPGRSAATVRRVPSRL